MGLDDIETKIAASDLLEMLEVINFYAKGGSDGGKLAEDFMNGRLSLKISDAYIPSMIKSLVN